MDKNTIRNKIIKINASIEKLKLQIEEIGYSGIREGKAKELQKEKTRLEAEVKELHKKC